MRRWGRKRRGRAVWVLLLICGTWPGRAVADDWLLALTAQESAVGGQSAQPAAPGLAVLYPRRGLPALVAAGETLVVRVRAVAALTPPPGRQQPRALSPWKASLHGHAHTLAAVPARHYPLAASLLRPDGGSSLVYRLSLKVPAWTAPGTYTLVLVGPGGERSVERGVRVLAAGTTPRLAWYPHGASDSQRASLSALPVDAWMYAQPVDEPAPVQLVGGLQPLLSTAQQGVVLRVGQEVLTLPACPSVRPARHDRGVDDVADDDAIRAGAAIARDLGLGHRCLPAQPTQPTQPTQPLQPAQSMQPAQPMQPPRTYVNLDHSTAALVALGGARGLLTLGQPRALSPEAGLEIDLTLAVAAGGGYRVEGGRVEFFPAAPPDAAADRLAARITRRPGATPLTIVARPATAAATGSTIEARPSPARAGGPVALSVGALPAGARVAWQLDGQPGAFGREPWSLRVDGSGAMEVGALVVGGDGTLRSERRRLEVASARRSGCQLGAMEIGPGPPWPAMLFGLLAWRTSRRRAVAARQ